MIFNETPTGVKTARAELYCNILVRVDIYSVNKLEFWCICV